MISMLDVNLILTSKKIKVKQNKSVESDIKENIVGKEM